MPPSLRIEIMKAQLCYPERRKSKAQSVCRWIFFSLFLIPIVLTVLPARIYLHQPIFYYIRVYDDGFHTVAYGVFTLLAMAVFSRYPLPPAPVGSMRQFFWRMRSERITALLVILVGLILEWCQSLPGIGRVTDLRDVTANVMGVWLALVLVPYFRLEGSRRGCRVYRYFPWDIVLWASGIGFVKLILKLGERYWERLVVLWVLFFGE